MGEDDLIENLKSIEAQKTQNLLSTNLKQGVSLLGVTGTVVELQGETKSVTPSTSAQTITPSSGKNGITQISVSAVTNAIDNNIQAGNIKSGVSILGVTGTFDGAMSTSDYNQALAIADEILGLETLYTQLEYIQSTGTQYIDTGVTVNSDISYELKYNRPSVVNNYTTLIGARNGVGRTNTYGIFAGVSRPNRDNYVYYCKGNSANHKDTNDMNFVNTDVVVKCDGWEQSWISSTQQHTYTYTQQTFSLNLNLYLFGLNDSTQTGVTELAQIKLYYCKIYNGNNLVRDFIPAKRISDNEVGLLDRVSGNFYTNSGTGSFIAGPVVEEG